MLEQVENLQTPAGRFGRAGLYGLQGYGLGIRHSFAQIPPCSRTEFLPPAVLLDHVQQSARWAGHTFRAKELPFLKGGVLSPLLSKRWGWEGMADGQGITGAAAIPGSLEGYIVSSPPTPCSLAPLEGLCRQGVIREMSRYLPPDSLLICVQRARVREGQLLGENGRFQSASPTA